MARSHARILVTIWADPEWRALPRDCQWFYELLLSQPQITHCGVVQIPRRGWENCSSDDDNREVIAAAMKILADRHFLVVDEDTDEIFVRSFMRHDGVISGPPGTLKNALVTARAVVSPRIRTALYVELSQLDPVAVAAKKVRDGHEHPIDTLKATLRALGAGSPPPAGAGQAGADDVSSDAMGNAIADARPMPALTHRSDAIGNAIGDGMSNAPGVGEGVGVRSSTPVATNSTSKNKHSRAPRAATDTTPEGFDDFWAAYPRKIGKRAAEKAYAAAVKRGVAPDRLRTAARVYARTTATSEQRFVAHPTTWLNQGRYDDEHPEPTRPAAAAQSRTTTAIAATDAAFEEWRARRARDSHPPLRAIEGA